ncbi:hypothetical protein CTI12_AA464290 [Artemisia annua]|uniref:ATPase, F1/V1/A1 complex, alpha/beta subunit, Zinc knuckle CX2CX4HX4C n=1 Tax=Artemisia annua TaxID=35608 RepID=A0A2U1LR06_ARTAN|nr:hypothetical protein CTI12_AA464290 [Artemisia annua]
MTAKGRQSKRKTRLPNRLKDTVCELNSKEKNDVKSVDRADGSEIRDNSDELGMRNKAVRKSDAGISREMIEEVVGENKEGEVIEEGDEIGEGEKSKKDECSTHDGSMNEKETLMVNEVQTDAIDTGSGAASGRKSVSDTNPTNQSNDCSVNVNNCANDMDSSDKNSYAKVLKKDANTCINELVYIAPSMNKDGEETVVAIASSIGIPKIMDQVTASMCQLGVGKTYYARVLVEVDAGKELKSTIKIEYVDKDKNVKGSKEVLVEYDWKPERCSHCKVFGHGIEKCGNRPRTVDELKEIETAKEKELKEMRDFQYEGFRAVQNRKKNVMHYKKNGQNRVYGLQDQRQEYRKKDKDIVDGRERKDETDKGNNYEEQFPALGTKEGRSKLQNITQRENKNRVEVLGSEGSNETLDTNVNQECQNEGDDEMVGMFVEKKRIPTVEESKQWAEYMFGWYKEKWGAKWKCECPI